MAKRIISNETEGYCIRSKMTIDFLSMVFFIGLICGGVLTGVATEVAKPAENIVFPGVEWERRAPEELGLNTNALVGIDELMKKAEANGVLIRNGYLVAEWTYSAPSDTRLNAKSQTKCILGIVYGLALDDGLIPSPDTRVKELWPDFKAGPYADEITFKHLASATSGLKTTGPFWQHFTGRRRGVRFRPPGMPGEYHNDHTIYLAGALTYLYGQDLLEVLRERVLYKIGSDADWITNGEGAPERLGNHGTFRSADSNEPVIPHGYVTLNDGRPVRWVSGFARSWWTAHDLARVGWLFLNDGNWNGTQLISEAYVQECFQYVPDRPYLAWRTVSVPENDDWWFMAGAGGQFCVLIPEHKMVMVKLNNWRNKTNGGDGKRPQVGLREFVPFLSGIAAPSPSIRTVDSDDAGNSESGD